MAFEKIKQAVPYYDYLFAVRGFNVEVYSYSRDTYGLTYETYFGFPSPVTKIEPRSFGLVVETGDTTYVIVGGPSSKTMFVNTLLDFALSPSDHKLEENGIYNKTYRENPNARKYIVLVNRLANVDSKKVEQAFKNLGVQAELIYADGVAGQVVIQEIR